MDKISGYVISALLAFVSTVVFFWKKKTDRDLEEHKRELKAEIREEVSEIKVIMSSLIDKIEDQGKEARDMHGSLEKWITQIYGEFRELAPKVIHLEKSLDEYKKMTDQRLEKFEMRLYQHEKEQA